MVVAADTVQMDSQAVGKVENLFQQQIEQGLHPGAALAVYRYGQPVLDLCGGEADRDLGWPVADDTMFVLYSSTKPMAAACLHILWERGLLAWDDAVAKYWPEFAQNGKGGVTIRHILTHQGGFPQTPDELTWDKWRDWNAVVKAMEGATPEFEPGTAMAYHPINFGWVIAEIVQRIDGRPFSTFFREELTGPLGMNDTYVGLPPSLEARVSRIYAMEDADRPETVNTFNRTEVHEAVVPAACGIASASNLARFYAMLERGGALDGAQVLKPETVAEVTKFQLEGDDRSLGRYVYRCLGMFLGSETMGKSRTDDLRSFGHGGAGTSLGWADPDSGLAMAYITNGFRGADSNNARLAAISQAVRDACL